MLEQSRVLHYLVWGAFIGALLLWGIVMLLFAIDPSLNWVIDHFGLFCLLCLIVPALEEYVFRGLIFDFVADRSQAPSSGDHSTFFSIANVVSSLFFVLSHLAFRGVVPALLVILPSLYLGCIRSTSSTVLPCVIVHAVWNVGWFSLFQPV